MTASREIGRLPAPIVPVSILVIDSGALDEPEPVEDEPLLPEPLLEPLMLLDEPGNSELLLPLLPLELGNSELELRLMGGEPVDPAPEVPPKPPPWEPPL